MMTPDDYATSAESLLDRVVHGGSNDPLMDAEVARAYALLAVASSLAQIAERLETTQPGAKPGEAPDIEHGPVRVDASHPGRDGNRSHHESAEPNILRRVAVTLAAWGYAIRGHRGGLQLFVFTDEGAAQKGRHRLVHPGGLVSGRGAYLRHRIGRPVDRRSDSKQRLNMGGLQSLRRVEFAGERGTEVLSAPLPRLGLMADNSLSVRDREFFLAEPHVAALSVSAGQGRGPFTVPIWYQYAPGGEAWVLTEARSRKVRLIETAGRFTLMVERVMPTTWYVSVEGPVIRTVPGTDALLWEIAARYLPPDKVPAYIEFAKADMGEQVAIYLRPERWLTADLGPGAVPPAGGSGGGVPHSER